jgi:hypothetical protein
VFSKIKSWLVFRFEVCLGYFGYFTFAHHRQRMDDILEANDDLELRLNGVLATIGTLQERHEANNFIITALLEAHGQESMVLKTAFLDDILKKGIETIVDTDEENNVVLTVQIMDQEEN